MRILLTAASSVCCGTLFLLMPRTAPAPAFSAAAATSAREASTEATAHATSQAIPQRTVAAPAAVTAADHRPAAADDAAATPAPAARPLRSILDRLVEGPEHLSATDLLHSAEFNPRDRALEDLRAPLQRQLDAHRQTLAERARAVRDAERSTLAALAERGALREVHFRMADLPVDTRQQIDAQLARRTRRATTDDLDAVRHALVQAAGRNGLRCNGLLRTADDRLLWAAPEQLGAMQGALRAWDDARTTWLRDLIERFLAAGALTPAEAEDLRARWWQRVAQRHGTRPPLR